MKIVLHWLILSAAVYATAYFVPGIAVAPVWHVLIIGACLMFLNTIVKPIIGVLTLPINIITLGLFSIALNALLFYALSFVINGFSIQTLTAALIGSIVVSVLNWIGEKVLG